MVPELWITLYVLALLAGYGIGVEIQDLRTRPVTVEPDGLSHPIPQRSEKETVPLPAEQ